MKGIATVSVHAGRVEAHNTVTIKKDNEIQGYVQAQSIMGSEYVEGELDYSAAPKIALDEWDFDTPGTHDFTVPDGNNYYYLPLPTVRDQYELVEIGKDATLEVRSGAYYVNRLKLCKNARIEINLTAGEVVFHIGTLLQFGTGSSVTSSSLGDDASRWITFNTKQATRLAIGDRSRVLGTVSAPNCDVVIGSEAGFKGAVSANKISTDDYSTFIYHTSTTTLPKELRSGSRPESICILAQNYPNPFNPGTTIEYGIPEEGEVRLRLFDLLGREVEVLADGFRQQGTYTVEFDGMNHPSGTYVYRLEWNGVVMTRRMTLLK